MAVSEVAIQRAIQLEAPKLGCRLFRNNVGLATTKDGSKIRFGLCKGSSDLIGWMPDGRFLAVEVKGERGRPSKHQLAFIQAVKSSGGVAGVCRSVEDFRGLVYGRS